MNLGFQPLLKNWLMDASDHDKNCHGSPRIHTRFVYLLCRGSRPFNVEPFPSAVSYVHLGLFQQSTLYLPRQGGGEIDPESPARPVNVIVDDNPPRQVRVTK